MAETAPEGWPPHAEALRGELERGRATLAEPAGASGEPAVLFVPCVRDGELLAIARLSGREDGGAGPDPSAFAADVIEACEKAAEIGALALFKAVQVADLQQRSFKDDLTGLPSRGFLEQVTQTEIHKACRYGRRLSCLCVVLDGAKRLDRSQPEQILHQSRQGEHRHDVPCDRRDAMPNDSDPRSQPRE